MDYSKINQTELDFNCGIGIAKLNIYTGRLLYECPSLLIGANSFQIGSSLIYNNNYSNLDFNGKKLGIGNGWKINLQQHLFPYKNSYALEGFSEIDEDYVYIDSAWGVHKFKKYKSSNGYDYRSVYYDESGTGLRLSLGKDTYPEIYDGNNNIIRFNENGNISEVISAVNSNIIKLFEYDTNNNLISIYDSRKPLRKMKFSYNAQNELIEIKTTSGHLSLSLIYDNNKLVTVTKSSLRKKKDILYLKYNLNNDLARVINAESLKTLEFVYDENFAKKVVNIKSGVMKEILTTTNDEPEVYLGENSFIGDNCYFSNYGKKIVKKHFEMPNNYVKNSTYFNYKDSYTDITNNKNMTTRYYFNIDGFTISTLENDGYNEKTLFKTSGWKLSSNGTSQYKINGEKANFTNNYKYKANTNQLEIFAQEFENYSNGEDSKYKYTENFVVSFWVKANKDITGDAKANLYVKKVKDRLILNDIVDEIYQNVYIAHAKANSWQYVTIPVNLGQEQYNLGEISISFSGISSDTIIEVADMRIAVGNSTSVILYDNSNIDNSIDLSSVTNFNLVHMDINRTVKNESFDVTSNFYMTEGDLFATYKSIYYAKQKNQGYFDFVCCGGTQVINVSSVSLRGKKINDENNSYINVSLDINSDGEPNYYLYSSNRNGEKEWSITEVQNLFRVDDDNNIYYEVTTGIQLLKEATGRINKSECSYIYEQKNIDGSDRKKRDEYGIVTSYEYDTYGNLDKIIIYNEDKSRDNDEKLVTEYNYSTNDESLREKPVSCKQNEIITYFSYSEPEFLPNYTLNGDSKVEYEYDEYKEKVLSVKNKNNNNSVDVAKNTFKYDQYGNIISASDLNGRTFGYTYNVFGEILKYYENGKLLLEKEVEKNSDYDAITEKIYNNQKLVDNELVNTAYETKTIIDNYGRILSQENKSNDNVEQDVIEFEYQVGEKFKESSSVLKVSKINDPYDGQEYTYIYDDENRPCGYQTSGNNEKGVDKTLIRQIGTGDTQYYFGADSKYYMSKIIKDDTSDTRHPKYINPRIIKTKYVDMEDKELDEVEENYKEVDYNYSYDDLGRLEKKYIDGIKYKDGDLLNVNNHVSIEKNIQYKFGTVLPSEIEYLARSKYWNQNWLTASKASMKFENTYDSKGNLVNVKSSGERFIENPVTEDYFDKSPLVERNYSYNYDAFDRLLKEIRSDDGVDKCTIEYDYSQTSDHLRSVTLNGRKIKEFKYDKGKRISIKIDNELKDILYDNYGNVVKDEKGVVTYNSRNLLEKYNFNTVENYYTTETKKSTYKYNHQGVRYSKVIETLRDGVVKNTKQVFYFLDGSRILGEKQITSDGVRVLKYLYDAEGITGINYDGCNFTFLKDSLGNVSKLMYQGKLIGEYVYDAWGNCTVIPLSIDDDATNGTRDRFVLYNNPFRWKSHYFDLETELYYVNGRYYSPVLMQYLNANGIDNLNVNDVNSYDRLAITVDNSITYEMNSTTIFTDTELYPDPTYDPIFKKTWWELNWKKAVQWIAFAVVLIVAIVLTCIPATSGFGIGMLYYGLQAAISGAIIGGLISGLISLIQGNGFMEGFVEGYIYGFINGFTTGALMFCASQAITALSKAASAKCSTPTECFIAGTLVLTSLGNKPIENIEIGDEVWSYNEKTGDKTLKKVVEVFKNKTKKWIHLLFEYEDGVKEEIVCTEEHPFYVNNLGWINSCDLLENDEVLLYNNCVAKLFKKDVEELSYEATTYNFEVEDFHTYYVGNNNLLVHNLCGSGAEKNVVAKVKANNNSLSTTPVDDVVEKAVHGNSLKCDKTNYGYKLVDNDTGEIKKFGESIRGVKRYTKKFYQKTNTHMEIVTSGTKAEIHLWQHNQIVNYYNQYGKLPPLNKSFW